MRQVSIRRRLSLWYSLALAIGLALFAVATWSLMWHTLHSDVDQRLRRGLDSLDAFVRTEAAEPGVHLNEELEEFAQGLPPGTSILLRDQHGRPVFASPRTSASSRAFASPRAIGGAYRTLERDVRVKGQVWQAEISESLEPIDSILSRLEFLLIALAPAIVALAFVGGLWLSRRALKPVDDITAAARSIGISNLSGRLTVPQTSDELQRLSETWNGMLARLEDSVSRLSRFSADASHELRTPLAVIRTTAEIAARRSRSEEAYREALTQIVGEADRMTRLIEDLLFLARCDSGTLQMPMSRMALAPVVEQLCLQCEPLARVKHLRLTCRIPEEPVDVVGNEPAIRRLILVLLDNAIKYSSAGGEVNVNLREHGDQLHLDIHDSGPGIRESEITRIFERFYRAPEARDGGEGGSGLGLSLAAGIAQQHHARIEVQSAPGEGSTFRVRFQPVSS